MARKWKSKRGPLPLSYVFLITLVFFVLSTAASLWIVNENIKPTLISYANSETRKIASMVVNKAINKEVAHVKDVNEIMEAVPGDSTKTKFNTEIINRVLAETTSLVQANLTKAEKGDLQAIESIPDVKVDEEKTKNMEGIVYTFPLGQITNNALLGNLGPRVPIRFHAIGDVKSDVKSNIEPYGINNAYVEVLIEVEVTVQIVVPFATEKTTITQDIPVAMGIIHGEVPEFYNNGGSANPSIEFPDN